MANYFQDLNVVMAKTQTKPHIFSEGKKQQVHIDTVTQSKDHRGFNLTSTNFLSLFSELKKHSF